MKKRRNTIARFIIAFFFITRGLWKMISTEEVAGEAAFLIPQSLFIVMAVIELTGGLLLFIGYKINFTAAVLAVTMVSALILDKQILPVFNKLAIMAALLLITNNDGETLLEFMEPDIEGLGQITKSDFEF